MKMPTEEIQRELDETRQLVERRLENCFPGGGLQQAMRYSLLAGGKRIRPILTIKFCQAAGGDPEDALEFACAVECLHTYSLIHDDLPCMDNDTLRRGKPTCHVAFDECTAVLAGDALQAAAFQMVLSANRPRWRQYKDAVLAMAGGILAKAAGVHGMCGGQYLDTVNNGQPHTEAELETICQKKTSALLEAACQLGVLAACPFSSNRIDGPTDYLRAAENYAYHLGLAFQIRDDVLDATSTTETLGKPVGSDAANQKTTYVSLLGVDACEERIRSHTEQAKAALEYSASREVLRPRARAELPECIWPRSPGFLYALADQLAVRDR